MHPNQGPADSKLTLDEAAWHLQLQPEPVLPYANTCAPQVMFPFLGSLSGLSRHPFFRERATPPGACSVSHLRALPWWGPVLPQASKEPEKGLAHRGTIQATRHGDFT